MVAVKKQTKKSASKPKSRTQTKAVVRKSMPKKEADVPEPIVVTNENAFTKVEIVSPQLDITIARISPEKTPQEEVSASTTKETVPVVPEVAPIVAEKVATSVQESISTSENVLPSEQLQQTMIEEDESDMIKRQIHESIDRSLNAPEKTNSHIILFCVIFVISIILGLSAFILYDSYKQSASQQIVSSVPKPTVTVIPSPTGVSQEVLEKYTIEVLNGGETKGEAGRARDFLVQSGFTVSDIDNADSSSYTQTIIKMKKSVPAAYIQALETLLDKKYQVDKVTQELDDSQAVDVILIIGSSTK